MPRRARQAVWITLAYDALTQFRERCGQRVLRNQLGAQRASHTCGGQAYRTGALAVAAAGGAAAVAVIASSPILGIIGLAGAGYLAYDWLAFRVKNGMRF